MPAIGAVVGLIPGVLLLAAYDSYATGGVFKLPFNALESQDRLGFGQRRLFPQDYPHYFGPRQSVDGFYDHFILAPLTWFAAGVIVLPLAVLAVTRWKSLAVELRWLAASTGIFFLGYLYFWGPWNASVLWGGPKTIGPFYALAVLVPITALACSVRITLSQREFRLVGGLAALVAVALSGDQFATGFSHAHGQSGATDQVLAAVEVGRSSAQSLMIEAGAPYLGHPVSEVLNAIGSSEVASNTVPPLGHRSSVLLQLPGDPYGSNGPNVDLVRQRLLTGRKVLVTVGYDLPVSRAPQAASYALLVQVGSSRMLCAVNARHTALVSLSPAGPRCLALSAVPLRVIGPSSDSCGGACIDLTLFRFGPGRAVHHAASRHLLERVIGRQVEVFVDGALITEHGAGWLTVTGDLL
jgi:hypothetical protein